MACSQARIRSGGALVAALFLLSACATRVPLADGKAVATKIPADSAFVFGRAAVETEWLLARKLPADVEFVNVKTNRRFAIATLDSGDYFVLLPPGTYGLAMIKRGFFGIEAKKPDRVRFEVPAGSAAYLGTFLVKFTDSRGAGVLEVHDESSLAIPSLKARYPTLILDPAPIKVRPPSADDMAAAGFATVSPLDWALSRGEPRTVPGR